MSKIFNKYLAFIASQIVKEKTEEAMVSENPQLDWAIFPGTVEQDVG